jgi:hypothetical protein
MINYVITLDKPNNYQKKKKNQNENTNIPL